MSETNDPLAVLQPYTLERTVYLELRVLGPTIIPDLANALRWYLDDDTEAAERQIRNALGGLREKGVVKRLDAGATIADRGFFHEYAALVGGVVVDPRPEVGDAEPPPPPPWWRRLGRLALRVLLVR